MVIRSSVVHEVKTGRTCEQLEALDPDVDLLRFPDVPRNAEVGDGVVIETSDGAFFIGEVEDLDEQTVEYSGWMTVSLR